MWHFQCIEFNPDKPKYLESQVTEWRLFIDPKIVRKMFPISYIRSCLFQTVNSTKATRNLAARCPICSETATPNSNNNSESYYLNDLVELFGYAHT